MLGLTVFILLFSYRRFYLWAWVTIPLIGLFFMSAQRPAEDPETDVKFLYRNEGVLAQLSVADNPILGSNDCLQMLFINNIPQIIVHCNDLANSDWNYPPPDSRASRYQAYWFRGLADRHVMIWESVAMGLKKMGFYLDIVELDKRVLEVAEEYFGFDPRGIYLLIDNGRHFLKTTNDKYDLIIVDVLNGEAQPFYIVFFSGF